MVQVSFLEIKSLTIKHRKHEKISKIKAVLLLAVSLGLIHKESSFFNVEIDETVLIMNRLASKVLSKEYMPVWLKLIVHVLL